MRSRHESRKRLVIITVVVLFVAAVFSGIALWEQRAGEFSGQETENNTLEYNGNAYVRNPNVESYLVIGLDRASDSATSASHESGSVQADFLLLFVLNNENKTVTALQINRDTMVDVNRLDIAGNKIGTEHKQIALAYNYAYDDEGIVNCRNTADSVSGLLLGVKVNHYLSMTMDAVPVLNDLVSGVTVTVADDFTGIDDGLIQGETVTLTGEQALTYVRARQGMEDSTNTARMARQRQYIKALLDKTVSNIESDDQFAVTFAEEMGSYLKYDATEFRLKELTKKLNEYEFLGVRELEGKSEVGEQFMEFYPNERSLTQTVVELFYRLK